MARKLLLAVLGIAFAIECLWPLGGFLAPDKLIEAFQLHATDEIRFLVFVLSWCLLFCAIICGLALRWVWKFEPAGWTLSYALGLWWVGIGGSLFLLYGKVENLFLDGLKGALIAAFAYASRGSQKGR